MSHDSVDEGASAPPAVETLVASLTGFWSRRRCVQLPALSLPIASATLCPHTFLRLRSARPWRVTRLQEVERPGRALGGGVGPVARRLEYQVTIQPALRAADRLLTKSLRALGLELAGHQFELREHRLETNLVGVSGVGWKAIVDGVPVARLSFLVQLGERLLEPPALEIVYLLERLAAIAPPAVAGRAPGPGGGTDQSARLAALRAQADREIARYWLEVVDPVAIRQRLDRADREAQMCLERSLVLPAYERVLESAHLLEILRARDLEPEDWEVRAGRCRRRALECADRWFVGAAEEHQEATSVMVPEHSFAHSNQSSQDGVDGVRDG